MKWQLLVGNFLLCVGMHAMEKPSFSLKSMDDKGHILTHSIPYDVAQSVPYIRDHLSESDKKNNCMTLPGNTDKDLGYIIDKVMRIVELFLTRPRDNKERESYQKEFQSREVIQTGEQRGGFSGFAKGIGKQ